MDNLKNHFCNFEQSQSLKELGFLGSCDYLFKVEKLDNEEWQQKVRMPFDNAFTNSPKNTNVACPLKSQAFEFLRNKFGLFGYVYLFSGTVIITKNARYGFRVGEVFGGVFNNHHEAESACIDRLIKLAKEAKNNQKSAVS